MNFIIVHNIHGLKKKILRRKYQFPDETKLKFIGYAAKKYVKRRDGVPFDPCTYCLFFLLSGVKILSVK